MSDFLFGVLVGVTISTLIMIINEVYRLRFMWMTPSSSSHNVEKAYQTERFI